MSTLLNKGGMGFTDTGTAKDSRRIALLKLLSLMLKLNIKVISSKVYPRNESRKKWDDYLDRMTL
jgi:hypothetical protein